LREGSSLSLIPNAASRLDGAEASTAGPFIVGTGTQPDGGAYVRFLAEVLLNDDLAFVGDCEFETLTYPLRTYAASHGLSPLSLLEDILRSPSGDVATSFFASTEGSPTQKKESWSKTPPSLRSISPEDTPISTFKSFASQLVVVSAPASWADTGWLVCARSSEGWGECADLSGANSPQSTATTLTVHFMAYFDTGTGYEIVLKDGPDLAAPAKHLSTIDAGAANAEGPSSVSLGGTVTDPKVLDAVDDSQSQATSAANLP
jgi:hypothetical protein